MTACRTAPHGRPVETAPAGGGLAALRLAVAMHRDPELGRHPRARRLPRRVDRESRRPAEAASATAAIPGPSPPSEPTGELATVMDIVAPRAGRRRRRVRRALRPLRRRRLPLHLLPRQQRRARRGPDQRDLHPRAAPDHLLHLAGPRLRRLAGDDRPQPHRRPLQVRPLPAGGGDLRPRRGRRRPPRGGPGERGPDRASPTRPCSRPSRQLGAEQQECISLRFLQGMSVAETAAIMGKNEGAIKALQYRAVKSLSRLLPEDLLG